MNSVPLFLSLPGPVGYQAATTSLNTDQMLDAIRRGTVKDALERGGNCCAAGFDRPAYSLRLPLSRSDRLRKARLELSHERSAFMPVGGQHDSLSDFA